MNPFGLAAGFPGTAVPVVMQNVLGSGMGGSMQFTVGTSAQFTLGQSFEISVGPPKIEIHAGYDDHLLVKLLCGFAGLVPVAFTVLYDVVCHDSDSKGVYDSSTDKQERESQDQGQQDAAASSEQKGDKQRALVTMIYQLLMDAALTAILFAEAAKDNIDWGGDQALATVFQVDSSFLSKLGAPSVTDVTKPEPNWLQKGGPITFGAVGALAAIAATVLSDEDEGL